MFFKVILSAMVGDDEMRTHEFSASAYQLLDEDDTNVQHILTPPFPEPLDGFDNETKIFLEEAGFVKTFAGSYCYSYDLDTELCNIAKLHIFV